MEDFYHREIDLRQETFRVTEQVKWRHDGDGKNSLAAKGKEKKTDVWQEYLLYHGRQLGDWSSNEQIHWRLWTVACFETL